MILAIDLGATNIKAAPFDGKLNKLGETSVFPTCAERGRAGIEETLERVIKSFGGVTAVAVSSAGDVDAEKAVIVYATENLPEMTGFDYKEFGKKFSLPVYAVNDAQAALLGEVYCGCGKGRETDRIAMLTLGSGVGGGYFAGGKLISDINNDYARFGHIILHKNGNLCTCGKRGCAETYLSGRAIHGEARKLGVDGDDIFKKYAAGEEPYSSLIKNFKSDLAALLERVYKVNPFDLCIIGGGVADWMGEEFEKTVSGTGYPLVKAKLGNDAGVYGACVHALISRGEL